MNFEYVFARLKEPSTWRGLSILLGVIGVYADPAAIQQVGVAVGATISAIEIFRKE
jgi:hypothetical protein